MEQPLPPSAAAVTAGELYEATKGGLWGVGTDETKVIGILESLTDQELKAVRKAYEEHYIGRSFDGDLLGEVSGRTEERLRALLNNDRVRADAIGLREALERTVIDRGEIKRILVSTPDTQALQEEYDKLFSDRPLRARLKECFRGSEQTLVVELLASGVDKTRASALQLRNAIEMHDFNTARAILAQSANIDALAQAYSALPGAMPLEESLQRAFQEAQRDLLLGLVRKDEALAGAATARLALKGLGTDEVQLRSVFEGMSESQREAIRKRYSDEYRTLFGGRRDLIADIDADLSGGEKLRTLELLKRGMLSEEETIFHALHTDNGDITTLERILWNKTKAEVEAVVERYRALHGEDLSTAIAQCFSGRERFRAEQLLRGRAETLMDEFARLRELRDVESSALGGKLMRIISSRGEELDRTVKRVEDALANPSGDLEEASRLLTYGKQDLKAYEEAKDAVVQNAATAVAATAATAAGAAALVVTGGAATPVVVGGITALTGTAGAVGYVATKSALAGQTYDERQLIGDALRGSVEGVTAFAGGMAAGAFLRRAGARTVSQLASHSGAAPLPAHLRRMTAEAAIDGSLGGGVAEAAYKATDIDWRERGVVGAATDISTAALNGLIMGGIGGALGGIGMGGGHTAVQHAIRKRRVALAHTPLSENSVRYQIDQTLPPQSPLGVRTPSDFALPGPRLQNPFPPEQFEDICAKLLERTLMGLPMARELGSSASGRIQTTETQLYREAAFGRVLYTHAVLALHGMRRATPELADLLPGGQKFNELVKRLKSPDPRVQNAWIGEDTLDVEFAMRLYLDESGFPPDHIHEAVKEFKKRLEEYGWNAKSTRLTPNREFSAELGEGPRTPEGATVREHLLSEKSAIERVLADEPISAIERRARLYEQAGTISLALADMRYYLSASLKDAEYYFQALHAIAREQGDLAAERELLAKLRGVYDRMGNSVMSQWCTDRSDDLLALIARLGSERLPAGHPERNALFSSGSISEARARRPHSRSYSPAVREDLASLRRGESLILGSETHYFERRDVSPRHLTITRLENGNYSVRRGAPSSSGIYREKGDGSLERLSGLTPVEPGETIIVAGQRIRVPELSSEGTMVVGRSPGPDFPPERLTLVLSGENVDPVHLTFINRGGALAVVDGDFPRRPVEILRDDGSTSMLPEHTIEPIEVKPGEVLVIGQTLIPLPGYPTPPQRVLLRSPLGQVSETTEVKIERMIARTQSEMRSLGIKPRELYIRNPIGPSEMSELLRARIDHHPFYLLNEHALKNVAVDGAGHPFTRAVNHPQIREEIRRLDKLGFSIVIDPYLPVRPSVGAYFSGPHRLIAIRPHSSWIHLLHELAHLDYQLGVLQLGGQQFLETLRKETGAHLGTPLGLEGAERFVGFELVTELAKRNLPPETERAMRRVFPVLADAIELRRAFGLGSLAIDENLAVARELRELEALGYKPWDGEYRQSKDYALIHRVWDLSQVGIGKRSFRQEWTLRSAQVERLLSTGPNANLNRLLLEATLITAGAALGFKFASDRLSAYYEPKSKRLVVRMPNGLWQTLPNKEPPSGE